jgi:hypothetical protein
MSAQSHAQQNGPESKETLKASSAAPLRAEALPAQELNVAASVQSFLEWKSARVHEAQQKLEQMTKNPNQTNVWQEGRAQTEGAEEDSSLQRPLEQKLNFNVDVALQLNIHDYFSMYLKTLNSDEFKAATKRLSDEEKTELLLAYKTAAEKEKKIPLKLSKIPKDNAKSKNPEIQQ